MKKKRLLKIFGLCFMILAGLICYRKMSSEKHPKVFLGGQTFSCNYVNEGVYFIDELSYVESQVVPGDAVVQIGDIPIMVNEDINRAMRKFDGQEVAVKVIQNGKLYTKIATVRKIMASENHAIRNYGSGKISMFLKELPYALLLSHSFLDSKSCIEGSIYPAKATGVDVFEMSIKVEKEVEVTGRIVKEDWFGVIAQINREYYNPLTEIEIALPEEIKLGNAQLYTDVGEGLRLYEIEIVAVDWGEYIEEQEKQYEEEYGKEFYYYENFSFEESQDRKYFLYQIIDDELIEKGIDVSFYGMSGSPIIQNGRLMGFVTGMTEDDLNYALYAKVAYEQMWKEL